MNDVAIRVAGVSKQYRIGVGRRRHDTLRDAITDFFRRRPAASPELIWALQDISFEVKRGEVVGIIGPNGAGKSTLLKILSRITKPTAGRVDIFGRLGSLLEVGSGFHPELTGRENIFLNGAILGMRKREIESKFDEIVEFSAISRFIDTPVKHYSSGMYVRLAFAVAAHLETDILLVDEILAVGDARFQQKCLDRMRDIGQGGRTVLFVSHDVRAITRLCGRAILIENGTVSRDGASAQVVAAYMNAGRTTTAVREWPDPAKAPGRRVVRLRAVRARTTEGQPGGTVPINQAVGLEMEYDVLEPGHMLLPNFQFYNEAGVHLFSSHDLDPLWRQRRRPAGRYLSRAWIPGNLLSEGTIFVGVGLQTVAPEILQFWEADAVAFQVVDVGDGDSARGTYAGRIDGVVRPRLEWTTEFSGNGDQAVTSVTSEVRS